jgi:hypothetical protein
MLEVKVICGCGQKFKFDTEPLEGRMAAIVLCPRCNADTTELANRDIANKLAAIAVPPAVPAPAAPAAAKVGPARVSPGPSAPKPVMPGGGKSAAPTPPMPPMPAASAGPPAPPAPGGSGLKVGNKGHAPAPAAPPGAPPPPPPVAKADDDGDAKSKPAAAAKKPASAKKPSLALACLGAFVGALLGTVVWVAVLYFAGIRSGYIALLVGVTAGFGAKLLGRGTSVTFGVVAVLCALLGIVGGNALVFAARLAEFVGETVQTAYRERMDLARAATAAKNDDELKKAVAFELAADRNDPQKVSAADLAKFKSEEMPKLRDLASGKTTKEQFETQFAAELMTNLDYGEILSHIFSIGAIISWIIAIGAAFKIASG